MLVLSVHVNTAILSLTFACFFRLVEEVKEKCSVVLEAEEIYMNTRYSSVRHYQLNGAVHIM